MNISLFLFVLFGLQALCFLASLRSSKGMKTGEDYFLANRRVRLIPLMMTFVATQVGGGLVLGAAEEAYKFGWSVLFYPLGASIGLVLLGLGMGRKLAEMQVSTIAELLEVIYGSKILRKIASLLSILSLFMILAAQFIASHKFMITLGVTNDLYFIGFWTIVIIYTAFGGLKAVIASDLIQATFFIGIFITCLGYVFYTHPVIPDISFTSSSFSSSKLIGWLCMPLFFMFIEQDMGQRCLATKSAKTVTKATIGAGLVTMFICTIPILFGILAASLNFPITPGSSVLMSFMIYATNPLLASLMGAAVLVAIISTADSLINAIGSNIAHDFGSILKLRTSQIIGALIGVLGIFFSFYFDNVVDLLIQSYELSISCLFVPISASLFIKKGNRLSASLSIIIGAISFALFRFYPAPFSKEIISLALSFVGYLIGETIYLIKLKPKMRIEKNHS
jgi:SSS family solute:Na+ symporter